MKFSAPYDSLEKAISLVNVNPIASMLSDVCQYVLIETNASSNGIALTKTDLDLHITSSIKANVEEPGRVLVHGDNFARILSTYKNLKKSDDCFVAITSDAGKLSIKFTDNKNYKAAVLATRDPDDFASIDEFVGEKASCKIMAAHLKDYFTKVLVAINKNDSRAENAGAYFKFKGSEIELVSSNRQEISVVAATPLSVKYHGGLSQAFSLIPRKTLEIVNKIIKGADPITVDIAPLMARISGEADGVQFSIINGTYDVDTALDGKAMIPTSVKTVVSIPTSALKNALAHMEAIMVKSVPNRVTIIVDPQDAGIVTLSCKSPTGEIPGLPIEATVEKTTSLDPSILIVNDQRLVSLLKAIRSINIRVSYNETGSACIFEGHEEPFFTLIAGSLDEDKTDIVVFPKKQTTVTPVQNKKITKKVDESDNFDVTSYEDLSTISDHEELEEALSEIQELEI